MDKEQVNRHGKGQFYKGRNLCTEYKAIGKVVYEELFYIQKITVGGGRKARNLAVILQIGNQMGTIGRTFEKVRGQEKL